MLQQSWSQQKAHQAVRLFLGSHWKYLGQLLGDGEWYLSV